MTRDWHPATVAVAWAGSHRGSRRQSSGRENLEQLESSLAAAEFQMSPELRAEISTLSKTPPLATTGATSNLE